MQARRAFTLIEVILVTVMMAMLAVAVLVRFSGTEGRRFEVAIEQVGDLMLMFAVRSEFAEEPVGIASDPSRNSLRLMLRRRPDELSDAQWVPDLSVKEIRLPDSVNVTNMEFMLDGDHVDPVQAPLTGIPQEVVLTLSPTAWRPTLSGGTGGLQTNDFLRTTEDLDNTGRWQEDW